MVASHRRRATATTALLVGGLAVVLQAVGTREALVVFSGNELVLALVLAVWHLGIVAGALAAGRLPARRADALVPLLLLLLAALAPVCMVGLRTARSWTGVADGQALGPGAMLGVAGLCLGTLAALIGALFPLGVALDAPEAGRRAGHIARFYGLEALASLVTGLLASLAALPGLGVEWTLALVGLLTCLAATLLAQWLARPRLRGLALLLSLGWLGAGLTGAPNALGERSRAARFASYGLGYQRLIERDSRHQNLVVAQPARTSSFGSATARALFAGGQYALSVPDPYAQAPRLHRMLALHPAPRQLLAVGPGILGALDEVYAHGVERIDYLDLDPVVLELLRATLRGAPRAALDDPRLVPVHDDLRRHARRTARRYDLVLIDLPDPTSALLNRAYTREFFAELRGVLAPAGVVVLRISAAEGFLSAARVDPAAAVWAALGEVFPARAVLPGSEALLAAARTAADLRADATTLEQRLRARQLDSAYFAVEEIPLLVPRQRQRELERALNTAGVPANSDLRPLSYYLNLVLLGHRSSPALATVLNAARGLSPLGPGLLGLLVVGVLAWRFRRRQGPAVQRRAALLALAATGLLGSAACLVLLFAFQNNLGVLYEALAALVGVFMAGLAAGSLGTARLLRSRSAATLVLAAVAFNALVAGALWPLVALAAGLPGTAAMLLLAGGLAASGAGVGACFAAVSAWLGDESARSAAVVDAADCAGAALGALLTGLICVPLLGVPGTALLLLAIQLGAGLLLLAAGLRPGSASPPEGPGPGTRPRESASPPPR